MDVPTAESDALCDKPMRCEVEASCAPGDHTFSWPCVFARGTGEFGSRPIPPTEEGQIDD